jgi:hypothetical protein
MVQSQAILRHVSRVRNLCGDSELERVECEMAEEALVEVRELLWRYQWRPDHQETAGAFVANELSPRLSALTAWYETHGSDGHWVKGRLTYVDFLAFALLDELRAFFPETLMTFRPLQAFHRQFSEQPRIAAYIASDRRPAAFGYAIHGLKIDPQSVGTEPT